MKEAVKTGIGVLGALGVAFALWEWGHTSGASKDDALVKLLENQKEQAETALHKAESALDDARAKETALRLELLASDARASSRGVPPRESGKAKDDAVEPSVAKSKGTIEREGQDVAVTLEPGRTATVLDSLNVTLVAIDFSGSPLRHRVHAALGAPGKANLNLVAVDVGNVTSYEGFEVRVVSVDSLRAAFRITMAPSRSLTHALRRTASGLGRGLGGEFEDG